MYTEIQLKTNVYSLLGLLCWAAKYVDCLHLPSRIYAFGTLILVEETNTLEIGAELMKLLLIMTWFCYFWPPSQ